LRSKEDKLRELLLLREIRIRKARKNFYSFCQALYPDFFKDETKRPHLKKICDSMEGLGNGTLLREDGKPYKKMILSVPP
jgi:hypothetical protein